MYNANSLPNVLVGEEKGEDSKEGIECSVSVARELDSACSDSTALELRLEDREGNSFVFFPCEGRAASCM